jgi:hypothetical protein
VARRRIRGISSGVSFEKVFFFRVSFFLMWNDDRLVMTILKLEDDDSKMKVGSLSWDSWSQRKLNFFFFFCIHVIAVFFFFFFLIKS